MKHKKIRVTEMEILAITVARKETQKPLIAAMERYESLMFPGIEKKEDSFEEQAKKILAEETKKIYGVSAAKDPREAAKKMSKGGGGVLARHFLKNENIYEHRNKMRKP